MNNGQHMADIAEGADQAAAREIGMAILRAERTAAAIVADAERRAEQLVSEASLARSGSMTPTSVDRQSLSAQIDAIESRLRVSHQRMVDLLDEVKEGDGDTTVSSTAPSPDSVEEVLGDSSPSAISGVQLAVAQSVVLSDIGSDTSGDTLIDRPQEYSTWAPPRSTDERASSDPVASPEDNRGGTTGSRLDLLPPPDPSQRTDETEASIASDPSPEAVAMPAEPSPTNAVRSDAEEPTAPQKSSARPWLVNAIAAAITIAVLVVALLLVNIF